MRKPVLSAHEVQRCGAMRLLKLSGLEQLEGTTAEALTMLSSETCPLSTIAINCAVPTAGDPAEVSRSGPCIHMPVLVVCERDSAPAT